MLESAGREYENFKSEKGQDKSDAQAEFDELNARLKERILDLNALEEETGLGILEKERGETLEYYNELKQEFDAGGDVSERDIDEAWNYLEKLEEDLQKLRADERIVALEEEIELLRRSINDLEREIAQAESISDVEKNLKERYEKLKGNVHSLKKRLGYFEVKMTLARLKRKLKKAPKYEERAKETPSIEIKKKEKPPTRAAVPTPARAASLKVRPKIQTRSFLEGAAFTILAFFILYLIYKTFKKAEKLSL